MPFGDLLKAAQTALGTVGEAVGGVVGGPEEGLLSPVTRDVVLVRPPADNIVAASLGRGAEWVKTRIQKEFRGYNCLLVDLTGEAGSLAVLHEGPVACFSCKEATPTLQMLWSFVAAVTEHLARPNSRVLVLLDGPGEGRAALCVICFMLYTSLFVDEKKAVAWYRGKRKDPVHFTPSQLRYLSYFSRGMSARQMFTPPPQVPALVRLITLRGVPVSVLSRSRVVLELEHVRAVYANGNAFSNRARVAKSVVYTPGEAGVVRRRGSVSTSPAVSVSGSAPVQTETVELVVNTYVEDDFNVTMWSVNEFRRREVLFNLQMHSSHLFPDAVQNGAVLTFPAAQMDSVAGCMGSALAVDVDVVCERRRDPFTTDDGSIVIVHKEQAPEPTGVRPSVSVSDMALLPRPASPASFGASTIACIPAEDLLHGFGDPISPAQSVAGSGMFPRREPFRALTGSSAPRSLMGSRMGNTGNTSGLRTTPTSRFLSQEPVVQLTNQPEPEQQIPLSPTPPNKESLQVVSGDEAQRDSQEPLSDQGLSSEMGSAMFQSCISVRDTPRPGAAC